MKVFAPCRVTLLTAKILVASFVLISVNGTPNYQGCLTDVAKKLPYCDASKPFAGRVASLVSSMTLPEKISRVYSCVPNCDTCPCGVERLGLPQYAYLLEANTAVAAKCLKPGRCATVFVGPMGLGGTFNRTAWRQKGRVLSTEVRAFQNNGGVRNLGKPTGLAAFGPNINIARDPRFGRNSELPGEDPFLNGVYGVEMTKGMQEKDSAGYPRMIAYLKHFTAYSRETNRGHDTYNISQYDFADTYLPQYEMGMKEGGSSGVMCSYNAENGVPSCANGWLLNDVLRKRWNRMDAVVVTDSGAVANLRGAPVNAPSDESAAAMALNNGSDINDGQAFKALMGAISQNLTSEARLDEALSRSLMQLFKAGLFDPVSEVSWTKLGVDEINSTASQQIVYDSALQSMILLKNDGVLPLKYGRKIAVVGPQADARNGLLSDYASEEACADGTDQCIVSIADSIRQENGAQMTTSAPGVEINSNKTDMIAHALGLAKDADVVILALGIDKSVEHEGQDRSDMKLPGLQEVFAQKVLALGKPTVLVLTNGGALAIDNLQHGPNAIVEAFNPCTVGTRALAAQVFGRENRWGKLPVTIYPADYADQQDAANFDMAKAPGRTYRYYTGQPLWPFGFGMSLTTFDMACKAPQSSTGLGIYKCSITNSGPLDGDEVVFAFHRPTQAIRNQSKHALPLKRLIAFERVSVVKGLTEEVEFELTEEMLSLATNEGDRKVYSGAHDIVFSRGIGAEKVFEIHIPTAPTFV